MGCHVGEIKKKVKNLNKIIYKARQTYVKVTAKGSPSGTATTTMVTYKISTKVIGK